MPSNPLPRDPDSLAKWARLPQNKPSKDALPPATGGTRWAFALLFVFALVLIIGLLLQTRPL